MDEMANLPVIDTTRLVYDKGHIVEWLSYAAASVASVVASNQKRMNDFAEEFVLANMQPLLEEDFRSCRTAQYCVETLGDMMDMMIKQLMRQKANMFNDLNIYYPGIETIKPSTTSLMTTGVQTDMTMIVDNKVTTGAQTATTTYQDAACGTEDNRNIDVKCLQDQSTSTEDGDAGFTIDSAPLGDEKPNDFAELMDISDSVNAEADDESVPAEPVVAVASIPVIHSPKESPKSDIKPLEIVDAAVVVKSDVAADEPSSPNLSEDESIVRPGDNHEEIRECYVRLERIPQNVYDYIRIHGSIPIVTRESPDSGSSTDDRELENALRGYLKCLEWTQF